MDQETRIYRPAPGSKFGGWIILFNGAALLGYAIVSYLRLLSLKPGNGSTDILVYLALASIPFFVVGTLLLHHAKNWGLTLDANGVHIVNMWGRQTFSARFDELTEIRRDDDPEAASSFIFAGTRKAIFSLSEDQHRDLSTQLKKRAPKIRTDR